MYTQPTDVMPCIYGYKYIYLLQISFKTVFWCCINSSVGVIGWKVIQTVMNISLFKAVRVLKDTYSINYHQPGCNITFELQLLHKKALF